MTVKNQKKNKSTLISQTQSVDISMDVFTVSHCEAVELHIFSISYIFITKN